MQMSKQAAGGQGSTWKLGAELPSHAPPSQVHNCLHSDAGVKDIHLLVRGDQVARLLVAELHLISQNVDIQELPNILFPVVGCKKTRSTVIGMTLFSKFWIYTSCDCDHSHDRDLSSAKRPRIFANSFSTRRCSCSLF